MFYIQLCWEALDTVQPCSHVRRQLKGVHYVCLYVCVCVCKVQGRGCDGELGALRIRQKDPRVGGQSSSSSLQTIESPSESNWAHSDIGPVDCTTKLSSHPAPSQLYICSPLPSPRPVCVPLMSHHALLIITHKHSQNATATTLVYLCCFFRAQKTAAVYLGMRTMSDCALYYNTQRQSATHTHTHTTTTTIPPLSCPSPNPTSSLFTPLH